MKLWFLIRKLLVSRHETKIGMPGNDKRYIGRYYLPVSTMRSAVRPSQRSGSSPRFHSPFISVSIALASSAESSPTNSLVPIRQVSGKRTGTLRVTLSKTGESVDFPITQVGLKPDATLTLSTESDIEMMALEPAEVTVSGN